MASSHLHSLILLCSISLLDCFYQRSNEEGVYSCWKVVPFSVEPRRMVRSYSGEPPKSQSLKMEVEVLKFSQQIKIFSGQFLEDISSIPNRT